MINHVSCSMLNLWLKCEVAWSYRYLPPRLIIPPQAAAHRGGAMHDSAEYNFTQKKITGQDEPESVLTDMTRDSFVKKCKEGVSIPKEDRSRKNDLLNSELNRAIEHTKIFHSVVAPQIIPNNVELEIWRNFDDILIPLMGRIDVTDENNVIRDFKSTERKKAKGWENTEIQPTFYTLLCEKDNIIPEFRYHIIKDNNDERSVIKTESDHKRLLSIIKVFIASIKTGIYKPAMPGSWWCNEKWCGYWPICEYATS